MRLVGRRLQMSWGEGKVVAIDKLHQFDQPEPALVFDVYEFNGQLSYQLIGVPVEFEYGRTADWYMQSGNNWLTASEVERLES